MPRRLAVFASLSLLAACQEAEGPDGSGVPDDSAARDGSVSRDGSQGSADGTSSGSDGGSQPGPDGGAPDAGCVDSPAFTATGAATATTTFQSISLYWSPSGGSASRAATVQYRRAGDCDWRQGLDLWFDARDQEYRGSLVLLDPGTTYHVKLALAGGSETAQLIATTWSDSFPIGETITVPATSRSMIDVTRGGSGAGYVLYTAAPGGSTIDVANNEDFCVRIRAAYVIVRGITCKNAARDGIRLETGAHDVVIEDNEISGWGRARDANRGLGINGDSGVKVAYRANGIRRIVVQRNYIHSPRWDSNDWSSGHPAGPLGIYFENCSLPDVETCGGNYVIRWNDVIGAPDHHFMDGIGGEDNFSATGFPHADTDIYENRIRYAWDDGIEAEGDNRNVRVYGNYIDETFTGIATAATHAGPIYIFRNIYDVSRYSRTGANDSSEHGPFGKLGDNGGFGGGRRYYFHNTLLQQPPPQGQRYGQGAGDGPEGGSSERPMVQVMSRNNIWHSYRPSADSIYGNGSSHDNDVDYDLHSGDISIGGSNNVIGPHGISGTPVYAAGNGPLGRDNGMYALEAGSPGHDAAERLPGFNDDFLGQGPDIGAAEAGASPLRFGREAARP